MFEVRIDLEELGGEGGGSCRLVFCRGRRGEKKRED